MKDLPYTTQQRLRMIDTTADRLGVTSRWVLVDFFGISESQASRDIADYMRRNQGALRYDAAARRYVATESFTPLFP